MATPTYTLIDSVTLASSAASVTFSSIDQSYGDLVLVMQTKSAGTSAWLQFNNSSSGYNHVYMAGNGSSASSSSASNQSGLFLQDVAYTLSSEFSLIIVNIMDYSATDKNTSVLVRNNTPSLGTEAFAGRWANNSAVNSVKLTSQYGTVYDAGTNLHLYGIAKAL